MLLMEAEQRTRLGRGTRGVSVWGHCVAVASRKVDEGEGPPRRRAGFPACTVWL